MITYSVIVPWHKDDELLKRALESVPVREDVELIAVQDKDFRGAGYARNQALAQARGRWLLFLDSDDRFSPDALDILDRHADDDADLIYFQQRAEMIGTGAPSGRADNKIHYLGAYSQRPADLDFYCRYCYPEPTGKMVRREMVEREGIRFDETSCANDYMFSVLCGLKARKVTFDPSVLYVVTEREGSVSHSYFDNPQKVRDRLYVYWRVQNLFDINKIPLSPFYGMWMMCANAGPQSRAAAEEFRRRNGISRWRIAAGCLKRIVRKRLHIGVPNNA